MKKINLLFVFTLISIGFSSILISSCNKSTNSGTVNVNGSLFFHLHTNVDTNEVDNYGQVYVLTGGRKISVSMAQMYISNIQLIKADGSVYSIAGLNLLKVQQTEPYALGSVPAGNYQSVRFTVGLDDATNGKTPVANDSTFNQPKMWFGNTAQPQGYIFVNFQGSIDTTKGMNSSKLIPFSYKIGTSARKQIVQMPIQAFSVDPKQVQYVHMVIDYNKLFTGIDLTKIGNLTVNTPTDNAGALATQISGNIPSMFSYEH